MNVASLELCKELYELSGWAGTQNNWVDDDGNTGPQYDSGYLLRKLPLATRIEKKNGRYTAYNPAVKQLVKVFEADTPEDALCKLAIVKHSNGRWFRK